MTDPSCHRERVYRESVRVNLLGLIYFDPDRIVFQHFIMAATVTGMTVLAKAGFKKQELQELAKKEPTESALFVFYFS